MTVFSDSYAHCLGRADRQVKLSGVRVELDEIENVVGSLPCVTGCAVFVDSVRGHDRLHAYVVASVAVTDADLRRAALAKLPASLVPHHWVRVDTLPKTTSGKVDRRRLS